MWGIDCALVNFFLFPPMSPLPDPLSDLSLFAILPLISNGSGSLPSVGFSGTPESGSFYCPFQEGVRVFLGPAVRTSRWVTSYYPTPASPVLCFFFYGQSYWQSLLFSQGSREMRVGHFPTVQVPGQLVFGFGLKRRIR